MNAIKLLVLVFCVAGAADWLLGNKLGIGAEFEKAFVLFRSMALSMLGMIIIAPAVGVWLSPVFEGVYRYLGMDPSIIPASLLANDMGGMTLSQSLCKSDAVGNFNAFVISSMMGCVISFTLPFSLGVVGKSQHKQLFFGLLCGIVTVPVGGFVAGIMCGVPVVPLLKNLLPLVTLSLLVGAALIFLPKLSIRCFAVFGYGMKTVAIFGLLCAVFTFLTDIPVSSHFDTLENAAMVCVNACVTLSGMLPLMFLVTKLLQKPLSRLSARLGMNTVSVLAFLGSTVTNASTFGVMDRMDKKGATLNAAFAVSASFCLGSHLAFTMAYDSRYILPMILGKLVSGVCAVALALLLYKDDAQKTPQ